MDIGNRDHAEALYYHIAGDAIEAAAKETDEFRLAEHVCTAMVFSALTLEAYINQQYASHKETAKLDLKSFEVREKWKMLPLLLGQPQTFDTGASPYQTFSELITLRNNSLVHFKPGWPPSSATSQFSTLVKDLDRARRYHSCIGDMIRTLNKLTGGMTDVPEGFLNGARKIPFDHHGQFFNACRDSGGRGSHIINKRQ
jgi:hypothetical protein